MPVETDRTLLYGLLADQAGLVDRETISAAFLEWVGTPDRPLGDLLRRRGVDEESISLLDAVVRKHLSRHGGDASRTLDALGLATTQDGDDDGDDWHHECRSLADSAGLQASDPFATVAATVASGPTNGSTAPTEFDPLATADPAPTELVGPSVDPHATSGYPVADPFATSAEGWRPSGHGDSPTPRAVPESGYPSHGSSTVHSAVPHARRFRILRPHAKGGLGAVLVAFDEELRREVALKEIQERHADDAHSRSRFLLEAEVTGGLEHPGIVPVYSLGSYGDGRPYYAMRFIRGESLRKAIDHHHKPPAGAPADPAARALELRGLLRRFLDVCEALGYAHSRRIVHRDVKPDNVMLGPFGETLVVDWGLAKALDRTDDNTPAAMSAEGPLRPQSADSSAPTVIGSAIGTPAYMSPEQAEGDIESLGPPTDVYSLGATLYHLLTGQPPFTDRNVYTMLIKVKQGEFPRPRSVNPAVHPALEAITLKAMANEIADRYPSCRALADDLERWLADEPVSVYREPLGVRVGRWARRHKTAVASVVALLATGLVTATTAAILIGVEKDRTERNRQIAVKNFQSAEANRKVAETNFATAEANRQVAVRERDAKDQQFQRAEANFVLAQSAVDDLLTEVGAIDAADVPLLEVARRNLLTKALAFYQEFLKQKADDPAIVRELGRAHARVGEIQEMLGALPESDAAYRAGLKIQEPIATAAGSTMADRADFARSLLGFGILLKKQNKFSEGRRAFDSAVSIREEIVRQAPNAIDARRDLAAATYQRAALLARLQGMRDEARAGYDKAIEIQRKLAGANPADPGARRDLARSLNNLGMFLVGTDRPAARKAFEEAIRLQSTLTAEAPNQPAYRRELARSRNNLANINAVDEPKAAIPEFEAAVAGFRGLVDDFPNVPDYRQELAGALGGQVRLLVKTGKADESKPLVREAEASLRKAIALRAKLVADVPDRPDYKARLALVRHDLAFLLLSDGQTDEARREYDAAIAIQRELAAAYPEAPEYRRELGLMIRSLATFQSKYGEPAEAEATVGEALGLLRSTAESVPGDQYYVTPLRDAIVLAAQLALDRKDHQAAIPLAAELAALVPDGPRDQYSAARIYAQAIPLVESDPALAADARKAQVQDLQKSALDALRRGAEHGLKSTEIQDDRSLKSIRDLPEFQTLLESMRAKEKPFVG